jgi:hypothetical protein
LASATGEPYLKYALFCRSTDETIDGDLSLNGIIDLVELPQPRLPDDAGETPQNPVLTQVDVNLAFCVGGAKPGDHYLFVALKTPGLPLDTPPAQKVEWEEGILFQRWIKTFRIPVQKPGLHTAAILFDGTPLGEASFLVRFKPEPATGTSAAS